LDLPPTGLGATERPPDAERLWAAADREEWLAVVQEQTEQIMHAVADMLPDPARVHERADRLTERAGKPAKRAAELRDKAKPD
jgi:ribosomal protein L13